MKKTLNLFALSLILFFFHVDSYTQQITTTANRGNGVLELLKRYKLSTNMKNIEFFQKINEGNFDRNGGLLLNEKYILPIFVVTFDGKTIRSTLGIADFPLAKKIEEYNTKVQNANLKKGIYQQTKEL